MSERQRIAKDLHQQTTYLNSLIENSPLGVVVLDQNDHVSLCNGAFENLFLFDREELLGVQGWIRSFPFTGDTGDANELTAQLATGRAVYQIARRARKDGKLIDVDINAVPMMLTDEVCGSLAIYTDISERMLSQQQAKQHAASLARLVLELHVRSAQLALLGELGDSLQCCSSLEEAYAVVAAALPKLFPTTMSGILYVFKSSRNAVETATKWGQPPFSETKFAPTGVLEPAARATLLERQSQHQACLPASEGARPRQIPLYTHGWAGRHTRSAPFGVRGPPGIKCSSSSLLSAPG